MANGYVQNMNPLFRQPFHKRFPPPQRPAPPSNDPSTLFNQQPAQCAFPNAFPAEGPNIVQRFWIRLFMTLVYTPYKFLRTHVEAVYTFLRAYVESSLTAQHLLTVNEFDMNAQMLMISLQHNSWSILIGLVVVVLACVGAYFFSPKGENNTYVYDAGIERSKRANMTQSLAMDTHAKFCKLLHYVGYAFRPFTGPMKRRLTSTTAITFLAQWHPLIEPRMTKLRTGYAGGS